MSKIIPVMNCLTTHLDNLKSNNPANESVRKGLSAAMHKGFGMAELNSKIAMSTILDPRFKNIHFKTPAGCENAIAKLKKLCIEEISSESEEEKAEATGPESFDFWKTHKELVYGQRKKKHYESGDFRSDLVLLKTPKIPQACTVDNHVISITNIRNGESICYSLAFIKGHIHTKNQNICHFNENLEGKLVLHHLNPNDSLMSVSDWVILGTEFKCLINLHRGDNDLILEYCGTKLKWSIGYCPRRTVFRVMPIYIICKGHNGEFQAPNGEENTIQSACRRIAVGCKLIQCLTAEKLDESGFGRKTFQLENDLNTQAAECTVFHSQLSVEQARRLSPEELWEHLGRELMMSPLGNNNRKFVAFLSCTRYMPNGKKPSTYEEILSLMEGHVALGGGGLAIFGTGCLHTWPRCVEEVVPRFLNVTPVDTQCLMDDSCFRGTYGGCFSTTLGSVCHELGHTFDLGHTEGSIMGRGFDNLNLVFTVHTKNDNEKLDKEINKKSIASDTVDESQTTSELSRDLTYWTKSCATILAFHRWFNSEAPQNKSINLTFDNATKTLSSSAGVCVVELRDSSGLVVSTWQPQRCSSFQLPPGSIGRNVTSLVAEDSVGNFTSEREQGIGSSETVTGFPYHQQPSSYAGVAVAPHKLSPQQEFNRIQSYKVIITQAVPEGQKWPTSRTPQPEYKGIQVIQYHEPCQTGKGGPQRPARRNGGKFHRLLEGRLADFGAAFSRISNFSASYDGVGFFEEEPTKWRSCNYICMGGVWKTSLSTPDLDTNPDLAAIDSLVYCESDALDNATT
uniref:Zinc metalloproteinase n=1 Tax=Timema cristinae TaxID=61476 RepID=A0A7R9CRH3_TIMCR|nr:unnamed protein product [Timema cristinae]